MAQDLDQTLLTEATYRIEEARRTGATRLHLIGFALASLPESIGQLTRLQHLYLANNRLTALPECISKLTRLLHLNLSGNHLTTLPESISQLIPLQHLDLANNRLIALPESISQLTRLQSINLSSNQLTNLPESISRLTHLQRLDLANNQLTNLPESISRLTHLQRLDLANNQLTALPESLYQLIQLTRLLLHGNDGLGIPPEILGPTSSEVTWGGAKLANPADILQDHYRQRRGPTRRLNEAKILIVGQGGVGKTSLMKRLVRDEFDPEEAKTEGIRIETWSVPADGASPEASEAIHLNIWDFGGQEIMHATHQFFLTRRSLYLVVLDARKGENESNIHYWLKIIQSYGGASPVLVVTNKCEPPNRLDLNERRLQLDYAPNLQCFFKVSSATGEGIPELREAIAQQVRDLKHVADRLPASYFAAKEALAARTENYIPLAEYRQLCQAHGVTGEQDQGILLRFLHDLGTVLNFDDPQNPYRLEDTNVLKPEWVTGGVYKILNSNRLMQQRGVLDMRRDMSQILNDPHCYPPDRYRFIIDMMRKFELCFDFPDSTGERVLVPELLSPNEPDLNWDREEALNFQYRYKVLPSGIISRFIVQMHHNLTRQPTYWRSGVVLEIEGNRALVRGDTQAGRIYISILGPVTGRRRALSVIRDRFRAIHGTIPRIGEQEKVPLPDDPDVVVDYEHLIVLEKMGQDLFVPEGATREYEVQDLLNGIEERSRRMAEQERRQKEGMERREPETPRPVEPPPIAERREVNTRALWSVGIYGLIALVVVVGGLAFISNYVQSSVAMTAITIAGVLFTVVLLTFLALCTGAFGEEVTARLFGKVLDKLPLLKQDAEQKIGKKGKS